MKKRKQNLVTRIWRQWLAIAIKHERFMHRPENIDLLNYEIQQLNKISLI